MSCVFLGSFLLHVLLPFSLLLETRLEVLLPLRFSVTHSCLFKKVPVSTQSSFIYKYIGNVLDLCIPRRRVKIKRGALAFCFTGFV